MAILEKAFGETKDGKKVYLYEINNKNGAVMKVSNFGALLVSLLVPDREGRLTDVVLGYDTVASYEQNGCYFGSTIGRSGNRIAEGSFTIDGKVYQMAQNENGNNLHSGPDGYQLKIWEVKALDDNKNSITFYRRSPEGEQGFPGNFDISVTYELTDDNALCLHYDGESDGDTVANMTNHTYFNLGGHNSGSIMEQELMLNADYYTPIKDAASIPTGELADVTGTPMDFRTMKKISRDASQAFAQTEMTGGYDHNFVLRDYQPGVVREVAKAYCEKTGIAMTVSTDLPGVQFYAGNFVEREEGKEGAIYTKNGGFCLETQYYPNAINEPGFPSPLLKAGETYHTVTSYRFTVE